MTVIDGATATRPLSFSLEFNSEPEHYQLARLFATSVLKSAAWGMDSEPLEDLRLAVSEACLLKGNESSTVRLDVVVGSGTAWFKASGKGKKKSNETTEDSEFASSLIQALFPGAEMEPEVKFSVDLEGS